MVICRRCGKEGFYAYRWVRSKFHGHRYRKYYYWYVGHYDAKKYEDQMENYRIRMRYYKQGLRDTKPSRPNGRTWCKVPEPYDKRYGALSDHPRSGNYYWEQLKNNSGK